MLESLPFLQDLLYECMLLEYLYSPEDASFTWVGRPGMFSGIELTRNPFIKLHFSGVTDFSHVFPRHRGLRHNPLRASATHFRIEDHVGAYESHGAMLHTHKSKQQILLDLTFKLGQIQFGFDAVQVEVLYTTVAAVGDTWVYRRGDNHEPIDFYRPFGLLNGR